MKFEVGKYYRTRAGKKVRCIATDGLVIHPIVCLVVDGGFVYCLDTGGRYVKHDCNSGMDIVSEWHEPLDIEMWVVLEMDGSTMFCSTYAQADYNYDPEDGDRIIRVRVTEVVE
jgi:hypothetical protein